MPREDDIALIRRLYDAFEAGDVGVITSTFADDVVWHEGGTHQLAGDYHGLDGVMTINGRAAELTNGTLQVDVHDILGSDDHVVILQRVSASTGGRSYSLDEVLVVHVEGAKVREVWVSYPDPSAVADLFA